MNLELQGLHGVAVDAQFALLSMRCGSQNINVTEQYSDDNKSMCHETKIKGSILITCSVSS